MRVCACVCVCVYMCVYIHTYNMHGAESTLNATTSYVYVYTYLSTDISPILHVCMCVYYMYASIQHARRRMHAGRRRRR